MPNHETNTVVVIGEPAKIQTFIREALIDGEGEQPERIIDFNKIIPRPDNIETDGCPHVGSDLGTGGTYTDEDGNERICWYNWTLANWGTKWGAYSHSHYDLRFLKKWDGEEVYGRIDLRFETAWSQPTPILKEIERRWGVTVHAVTQDEGGYPDVEYGDPYESEVIERKVTHEFQSWETEVPAPQAEIAA